MTKHWKLLLVRLQHSHTEFIRKKKKKNQFWAAILMIMIERKKMAKSKNGRIIFFLNID